MQLTYSIKLLLGTCPSWPGNDFTTHEKGAKVPKVSLSQRLQEHPFCIISSKRWHCWHIHLVWQHSQRVQPTGEHLPHLSRDWKLPGEFLTPLTVFLQRTKNLYCFCVIFPLLHLLTVLDCNSVGVLAFSHPSIHKCAFPFSYSSSSSQYENHGAGVFLSKALSHTHAANGQTTHFTQTDCKTNWHWFR